VLVGDVELLLTGVPQAVNSKTTTGKNKQALVIGIIVRGP
jgi:hypothetical protein